MARYFAYGTLLDGELMRRIAPGATVLGVACLDGYELAFAACADPAHGGCTLARRDGAETWGVQYELPETEMQTLDAAAGIDKGHWRHQEIMLRTPAGRRVPSRTYVIPNSGGAWVPPDAYVAPILKGADALDFPPAYRARLRNIVAAAQGAGRGRQP